MTLFLFAATTSSEILAQIPLDLLAAVTPAADLLPAEFEVPVSLLSAETETETEEDKEIPLKFLQSGSLPLVLNMTWLPENDSAATYDRSEAGRYFEPDSFFTSERYAVPEVSQYMDNRLLYQPFADMYNYVYDEQIDDAEDEIQKAVEKSVGEQLRRIEFVRESERWLQKVREKRLTVKYEREGTDAAREARATSQTAADRLLFFKFQPSMRSMKPYLHGETNQIPLGLFDRSEIRIFVDEAECIFARDLRQGWVLEAEFGYDGRASATVSVRNTNYIFAFIQDNQSRLEFRYILDPMLYRPFLRWFEGGHKLQ